MATTSPDNIPYVGPTQYNEPADFPQIDEEQAQAIQTLIATLRSQIAAITSNTTGPAVVPVGTIVAYGGTSAPTGWHLCDGTAHGSAALTAVLGSASTPDLRNRFVVGAGSSYTRGNTGGADSVTLTAAQSGLPAHTHTTTVGPSSADHTHWVDPPAVYVDPENQGHYHSGTTAYMNQNWAHGHSAGTGGMSSNAVHSHNVYILENTSSTGTNPWFIRMGSAVPDVVNMNTAVRMEGTNTDHTHGVSVYGTDTNHTHSFDTGGISQGHQHYLNIGGFSSGGTSATHIHAVTVNANTTASAASALENRPPYYALVYIIKK